MVEHTAVNRGVAGSSPARGVKRRHKKAVADVATAFLIEIFYLVITCLAYGSTTSLSPSPPSSAIGLVGHITV